MKVLLLKHTFSGRAEEDDLPAKEGMLRWCPGGPPDCHLVPAVCCQDCAGSGNVHGHNNARSGRNHSRRWPSMFITFTAHVPAAYDVPVLSCESFICTSNDLFWVVQVYALEIEPYLKEFVTPYMEKAGVKDKVSCSASCTCLK